jgi:hypothetical protein
MVVGGDENWGIVTRALAAETDLKLLAELAAMAAQIAPDRGRPLLASAVERLQAEGAERVRQLAEAILSAATHESVLALAKLAGAVDTTAFAPLFEGIAEGQTRSVSWQSDGFRELRNSISAYDTVAHDQAIAFYQSLLPSGSPHVREVAVYGCGELRVAEAVPELLAAVVPDNENCMRPGAVCVALGKMGSPEAHDGLIAMVGRDDLTDRDKHAIATVMTSICGRPGRGPDGTWANGTWYTVADDISGIGPRFADALTRAAEKATEERFAGMLAGRARTITEMVQRQEDGG